MEKNKLPTVCGLITDFGEKDYFIGIVKAVMKRINSSLEIIDITNNIKSYSILAASFALEKSYRFFPNPAIFLVVIDPGVGTERNILLVEHNGFYFICPDNGALTPILKEKNKTVYKIDNKEYFLVDENTTFEARDKMAPIAAHLSLGVPPTELGTTTFDYIISPDIEPTAANSSIKGKVVYIDKFGNIMTNITRRLLFLSLKDTDYSRFKAVINDVEIRGFYNTYALAGRHPFMLIGSHQNVEIAKNQANAADELKAEIGQDVTIKFF